MNTSLFELFKIGIGPSSSHTVGPMRAALRFTRELAASHLLEKTAKVNVDLYGSLALTGIGHGTDRAILLGLLGEAPDTVDPATIETKIAAIRSTDTLALNSSKIIPFTEPENLTFRRNQMYPDPAVHSHPNGMRFTAFDNNEAKLAEQVFYSVGGGFIVSEAERTAEPLTNTRSVPYPFRSAADLLATAKQHNLTIANLLLANEVALLNDPNLHINRPETNSIPTTKARVPHPSQPYREGWDKQSSNSPSDSSIKARVPHPSQPYREGWDVESSHSQSSPPQSPEEKIQVLHPSQSHREPGSPTSAFARRGREGWDEQSSNSPSDSSIKARVPHPSRPHREGWDVESSHSQSSTPPQSPEEKIKRSILALWQAMQQCTQRGIATEGILPGGLNVRRRAHRLAERLNTIGSKDPLAPIDWVTVYAMAVNEENAAGGRVVTAPTNGAAGVIPAIANYYTHFIEGTPEEKEEGILRYFLTAAAIGILYKENASISGAEVGCQGEVGVACSMAAGGLVAALNGTNAQIEHAAEIAMEHNLGMTCDPIGGLVQIPCIERNGMGAVKAINACRMAMHESGDHKLSLDQVIATMYQTGLDMQSRYKETSLAGLALNIIEC